MRIFAFNTTHDSSVCSLNNGEIEFFCKEERLSRIKRDGNPVESINKYLTLFKDKVDYCLYCTPTNYAFDFEFYNLLLRKKSYNLLENTRNFSDLTHHQCHAMLAYVNSKFKECLVFVIDRNGSIFFMDGENIARESESVYLFNENKILDIVCKNFWCDPARLHQSNFYENKLREYYLNNNIFLQSSYSIVKVYEAATTMIGQNQLENGKTMGLSSYGNYKSLDLFDSNFIPNDNFFNHKNSNPDSNVMLSGYEDKISSDINHDNFQFYADIAKAVQVDTQTAALSLIEKYVKATGIKNVCLVGGYGLNVVANNYYLSKRKDINFYFEPISDDTGIPIGACFLAHKQITGKNPKPLDNTFFHYYDLNDSVKIGKKTNIDELVSLLCNKKSIGFFNGPPEAGPRALGHRSILFDPRNKDGKQIVNNIKKREWYRPFAGIILENKFGEWFNTEGLTKSENMTINFFIKEHLKENIKSIVHVDGSCRIQTVCEKDGMLNELLLAFYKATNCPLLLNTSLNLAGEPLVQTKQEALDVLKNSTLDYVYFADQNILVSKKDL